MNNCHGIYQITNTINGKLYVGSSINIADRWRRHKEQLRKKIHNCKPLQSAWDKYGEYSFIFSILEFVDDKNNLLIKEQEYLDLIRPFDNKIGYNCCKKAYSTLGIKYSEDARKRVSEGVKKAHASGAYDDKNKKQKGVKKSPFEIAAITAGMQKLMVSGYKHSLERNAKIAAARIGKKYPKLSASLLALHAERKLQKEATTI